MTDPALAPPIADAAPARSDDAERPDRILIVEDSPTQALKLRHMLEKDGYAVDWATSAEAAFDVLNERTPDLVIADFHLPGMNGDGLARQIRMTMRTRTLPVLMLTEASERGVERHGLESGADAYLSKSSPEAHLLLRIRALVRRRAREERASGDGSEAPVRYSTFRRARLLVVADDGPNGGLDTVVSRALRTHEAFEVTSVAAPEAALARVAAGDPAVDCVVVDMTAGRFDGRALVVALDALRAEAAGAAPGPVLGQAPAPAPGRDVVLVGVYDEERMPPSLVAEAYAAGLDDMVPATTEPDMLDLRVSALVRRKLLREENRRIESDFRDRELAVERARAETAAAEARAALAGELEQANRDLADTNRRLQETQSQLVHAAKMASLGELVAGIAHEINNPLAFVLAHHGTVERMIRTLAERAGGDAEAERAAGKALDRLTGMKVGLKRIQDLVLNLRKFSRLDEGETDTLDVPASIETVLTLLSHKLGEDVTVVRRFAGERTLVASPALIDQVVMNIVGNAADAIGAKGTITIETRSDAEAHEIAISDDGPGVPADLKDRIFEPFFTTKPVGAGTGLGLAISYGVVTAHGGDIAVETAEGGGARFVVRIPRRRPE